MPAAKKVAAKAAPTPEATPTETPSAPVADIAAAAQEQFQNAFDALSGNYEEMRAAFEKTQTQFAEANADIMQAAQTEVSDAVQFANDLSQAKSFGDILDLQQAYFTNLFDTRIERAREMTELSVEAAKNAMPQTSALPAYFDPQAYTKFFPFTA